MTDDLSDADYQRLATFRHALRVFLHFSEEAARDQGLTPNQHQLLLAVRGWRGADPPTLTELADVLQIRVHSTGELARRAVAANLVELRTDPADHRRQRVSITPVGAEVLRTLTERHREELRRFRSDLADLLDVLDGPDRPVGGDGGAC